MQDNFRNPVTGGFQIKTQHDVAIGAAKTADGNDVFSSGDRIENHTAVVITSGVIIILHQGECAETLPLINAQQRVECTTRGGNRDDAGGGSNPGSPNR